MLAMQKHLRPAQAGGPEAIGVKRGPPVDEAEIAVPRDLQGLKRRDDGHEGRRPPDDTPPQRLAAGRDVVVRDDVEEITVAHTSMLVERMGVWQGGRVRNSSRQGNAILLLSLLS